MARAAPSATIGPTSLSTNSAAVPIRITRTTNMIRWATACGSTNFMWDGENVLAELDQNRVTQAQYAHAPGTWGGLVSQRRGGASSCCGFDQSGSTRALVSPAAAITDSYSYKAFGLEL